MKKTIYIGRPSKVAGLRDMQDITIASGEDGRWYAVVGAGADARWTKSFPTEAAAWGYLMSPPVMPDDYASLEDFEEADEEKRRRYGAEECP